ncbi:MAG: DUF4416 family protein [SAR324 cluster bacterium]|nr:DUF4416 family protein [SAR324 cluster bacterium]
MEAEAPLVKRIAAILFRELEPLAACLLRLEAAFGPLDYRGAQHPFVHSSYYDREMGAGLSRCIVAFAELMSPAALVEAKWRAHQVEQDLADGAQRRVNVDVGYLDLHKLVLASFKGRGHKLYLDRGVWADMTLVYQQGAFSPLPWSFPDFAAGIYDGDLSAVRNLLKAQLRER